RRHQLLAAKAHGSVQPGARRQEAHYGLHGDALARSALADDAQHLAIGDVELDAADGLEFARRRAEGDAEGPDLEEGGAHGQSVRGSRWSRRPSPTELNPRTTMRIAMPGPKAIHQW